MSESISRALPPVPDWTPESPDSRIPDDELLAPYPCLELKELSYDSTSLPSMILPRHSPDLLPVSNSVPEPCCFPPPVISSQVFLISRTTNARSRAQHMIRYQLGWMAVDDRVLGQNLTSLMSKLQSMYRAFIISERTSPSMSEGHWRHDTMLSLPVAMQHVEPRYVTLPDNETFISEAVEKIECVSAAPYPVIKLGPSYDKIEDCQIWNLFLKFARSLNRAMPPYDGGRRVLMGGAFVKILYREYTEMYFICEMTELNSWSRDRTEDVEEIVSFKELNVPWGNMAVVGLGRISRLGRILSP